MPAKKEHKINLLPQEEFASSTLGRALKWALSTFRIIVFVTEFLVMIAFLSRFWLDAKNSDLTDNIKQKQAIIEAQADFEKTFRDTQKRLSIFQNISGNPKKADFIDKLSSKVPNDVTLTSISMQDNSAAVKGISVSEQNIAQFISNLKSEPTFKKVSLGQVNQSPDNSDYIVFNIKLSY